ncbi:MAG: hypothetical protein JSW12_09830 [Deltaproteobacteria bacterium]|nr:MAG: hypothetical protein JSW12_09830 [Deltaproteobacteria bacterium]
MDSETIKRLWALSKLNKALIEGLKLTIFVLKNEEQLAEARRRFMVKTLEELIAQSEEVYRVTAIKR